jgi:glutamine synthetase
MSAADQFSNDLEKLIKAGLETRGIGFVAAELQNAAADLIESCDDMQFKKRAVKRFAERIGAA